MKGNPRIHTACAAIALFAIGICNSARATDRVYLPDETGEVTALHWGTLRGFTELMFRAAFEKADEFDLSETLISPRLHLGLDGSVYHEKFMAYNLDGSVSYENYRVSGDLDRSDNLVFGDYNASIRFFKDKFVNVGLMASRNNA
jgi:hypothetical protein